MGKREGRKPELDRIMQSRMTPELASPAPGAGTHTDICRQPSCIVKWMWESLTHLHIVQLCLKRFILVLLKTGLILWNWSTNFGWLQPVLLWLSLAKAITVPLATWKLFIIYWWHRGIAEGANMFYLFCFWLCICHKCPRGQNIWIKPGPLPAPKSIMRILILKNALVKWVSAAARAIRIDYSDSSNL